MGLVPRGIAASGGGAATAYGPSIVETFATDSANLRSSPTTPTPYGGPPWTQISTDAKQTTPFISGGAMQVQGVTANDANSGAYLPAPGAGDCRWQYYFAPVADALLTASTSARGFVLLLHVNELVANSSYSRVRLTWTGSANGGVMAGATATSGELQSTSGGNVAISFVGDGNCLGVRHGDTVMVCTRTEGAAQYVDVYLNGHLVLDGQTNIAGLGITLTGVAGVYGDGSTTYRLTQFTGSVIDTECDFWLYRPGRTLQVAHWNAADDTAVHLPLVVRYSGPVAPSGLTYTIHDNSADTLVPITGLTDQPWTPDVIGGGEARKRQLLPTSLVGGRTRLVVEIKWPGLTIQGDPAASVSRFTPVQFVGEIFMARGQSRVAQLSQNQMVTGLYTNPTNGFVVNGSPDATGGYISTVHEDRRVNGPGTTTVRPNERRALTAVMGILEGLIGHGRITVIQAGFGGKDEVARAIGSSYWDTEFTYGLGMAGDIYHFHLSDFAYEFNNADGSYSSGGWLSADATLLTDIICDQVAAIETWAGHPILVYVSPGNPVYGINSAVKTRSRLVQKTLMELVRNNGDGRFASTYGGVTRFVEGANVWDVQRGTTTEVYHNDNTARGRFLQADRMARDVAGALGVTNAARLGPKLDTSGHSRAGAVVTVRLIAPPGAVSIDLVGTDAANPSYGFEFFKDSDGSALTVTSVGTPSAISGGTCTVAFTLSADPGVTVRVKAPGGNCPYALTGAVNADMSLAKMIVANHGDPNYGTLTFGTPVGFFYDWTNGRDYALAA